MAQPEINAMDIDAERRRLQKSMPELYEESLLHAHGMIKAVMDAEGIRQADIAVAKIVRAEKAAGKRSEHEMGFLSLFLLFALADMAKRDAMAAALRADAMKKVNAAKRADAIKRLAKERQLITGLFIASVVLLFCGNQAAAVGLIGIFGAAIAFQVVEWAEKKKKFKPRTNGKWGHDSRVTGPVRCLRSLQLVKACEVHQLREGMFEAPKVCAVE